MQHVNTLIIGAGPTGCGAAWQADREGIDWMMVETLDGPGGMARSIKDLDGFTWDLGGHVLHSHFRTFDMALEGIEMTYPTRNGWIWMNGQMRRTPIQHNLASFEMPLDAQPDADAANLNEYYRNQFGTVLAEEFFIPFQEKMWATDTHEVSHEWTSLRNGSAERNVPQIKVGVTEPEKVNFPYPKGGNGAIWNHITGKLSQDRIRYETRVISIDPQQKVATLIDDASKQAYSVGYEHIVSSMPLMTLMNLCGIIALTDGESLRTNEVRVVGFGVNGEPPAALADKSWVYCPDRDAAWQRATMLSNYDQDNAGEGRWNILFEVGRSGKDHGFRPISDNLAYLDCANFLVDMGVPIGNDGVVASVFEMTVPMGYPVPTLSRDAALLGYDRLLVRMDIRSRGRFGGMRYESCNQDYSFEQGVQAIEARNGLCEDAYWNPERYS